MLSDNNLMPGRAHNRVLGKLTSCRYCCYITKSIWRRASTKRISMNKVRQKSAQLPAANPRVKLVSYGFMLVLPLLLLALLEFACRLLPQYDPLPLFIDGPVAGYLQPNPQIVRRYVNTYAAAAPKVAPDTQYFLANKNNDTVRIVVAGESTAAGFPYGRFGSPAALLQEQFKRQYPDQSIEVISVAMAAINSYTVQDLLPEILAISPDAVVLYLGHNEYVGLLGVGSKFAFSESRSQTMAWLWLRRLALYQVMEQLLTPEAPVSANKTAMSQVAKSQGVAYGSADYQLGVEQFQQNMQEIYRQSKAAGVKLVVSSLVSNDTGLAPFLATPAMPELEQYWQTQQFAKLQDALQQGLKQTECHAQVQYWQARWLALQGYPAAPVFIKARDCDELRFRAPSDFNRFLREWQSQEASAGLLWLADVATAFTKQSPVNGVGNEWLLEHVHPNQQGYQLLAAEWLRTLEQAGVVTGKVSTAEIAAMANQPASLLSPIDQGVADYKIKQLLADYPFTTSPQPVPLPVASTPEQQLVLKRLQGADWLALHQELLNRYQQQQRFAEAAAVAALLSDALPFDEQLAALSGQLYSQANLHSLAVGYLRRALVLNAEHRGYRMLLARSEYLRGRLPASLQQLEQVLQRSPDYQPAQQQAERIRQQLAN